MLHRLAVDLKMDALLYQMSVFSIFNQILSDPAAAAYKVPCVPLKRRAQCLRACVLFKLDGRLFSTA